MNWTTAKRATAFLISAMGVSLAVASDTSQTRSTASIQESASVLVVSDVSMQTLLTSGAMASAGVTFTVAPDVGSAALGIPGFVGGGAETIGVSGNGLVTGVTMNGEALSVSVGSSLGDVPLNSNAGAGSGVSVVIAQYN